MFARQSLLLLLISGIVAVIASFPLRGDTLLPSICSGELPADSTPICPVPVVEGYQKGFDKSGLKVGTTVPDFTLYDLQGKAFNLDSVLSEGKPLFLVHGSYTCPIFRSQVTTINRLMQEYGEKITIAVIYTVEAHPIIDTSVYFGYVYPGQKNEQDSILYPMPRTYGERKQLVADLIEGTGLQAPVYVDSPCNEWWSYYGKAPNNACLIETDGKVFASHGWFDRKPNDIDKDIKKLLKKRKKK